MMSWADRQSGIVSWVMTGSLDESAVRLTLEALEEGPLGLWDELSRALGNRHL